MKIQDGCNRRCAYCIIPRARGRSRSIPKERVLPEIEALVAKGCKEIVFTGIHLGGWGTDLEGEEEFTGLMKEVEERRFPCRFRISSIDPDEVTNELISMLARGATFCNHLHMPLQSGSDRVLSLMGRAYTTAFFSDRVERVAREIAGVNIGTDIIAGFPGETDDDFEETLGFLAKLPISYIHIFPYSKRKGTEAAAMKCQLTPPVIKERCQRLKQLDMEKRKDYYTSMLGARESVLVEGSSSGSSNLAELKGRTRNYIPVRFKGEKSSIGTEVEVVLSGVEEGFMTAVIEDKGALAKA